MRDTLAIALGPVQYLVTIADSCLPAYQGHNRKFSRLTFRRFMRVAGWRRKVDPRGGRWRNVYYVPKEPMGLDRRAMGKTITETRGGFVVAIYNPETRGAAFWDMIVTRNLTVSF